MVQNGIAQVNDCKDVQKLTVFLNTPEQMVCCFQLSEHSIDDDQDFELPPAPLSHNTTSIWSHSVSADPALKPSTSTECLPQRQSSSSLNSGSNSLPNDTLAECHSNIELQPQSSPTQDSFTDADTPTVQFRSQRSLSLVSLSVLLAFLR